MKKPVAWAESWRRELLERDATSDVLNNPDAEIPIPGALSLFAGVLTVFAAILNILLGLNRRR